MQFAEADKNRDNSTKENNQATLSRFNGFWGAEARKNYFQILFKATTPEKRNPLNRSIQPR